MALIVAGITLQNGIHVQNAYVRISGVQGNKDNMFVSVDYYVSQQAFQDGLSPVTRKTFEFVPSVAEDAPNFIKQGYEYLKTLPEFLIAIDA